jgi:hypothetical protein
MQPNIATANIREVRSQRSPDLAQVWALPDMSILSAGRRVPPSLYPHQEMFGGVWSLLADLAEATSAPVDYVALSFLSACASLIGGKRWVKPYANNHWSEPCILWMALVGDPSSSKSPAISAATDHLRGIERDHAADHDNALMRWEAQTERANAERAAWKKDVEAATKDKLATPSLPADAQLPDMPVRRRLLVQDATPEAIGAILAGNPSGTLHLRDELAGWLMSFERYAPGGREFWLEAYGGRPHVIDRKGAKGPISIPFNGVSVLGGVQPEKLAACLLDSVDDGLVARFLWAWPDPIPYRRPEQVADLAVLDRIYRRLDSLRWGTERDGRDVGVTLAFDDAASRAFATWAAENQSAGEDGGSLFKGFCGKLRGTVLRLSLTVELVTWAASTAADEPGSISAQTVGRVCDFIDNYAMPSALRVFGDAALPPVERNAATLGRYIRRFKLAKVNARDVHRKFRIPGMKDAAPVNEAIELLVEADWLRGAGQRQGDTPGRRSADYIVNPAVFGGSDG